MDKVRPALNMKRFSTISSLLIPFTTAVAVAVVMTLGLSGATGLQADPTDDLSFSLGPSHGLIGLFGETTMPESRVVEIFQDRLDLFPRSQAPKLAAHLMRLCSYYRFDPAFVLSLVQVESRFRIKVQSPVGAVGLMQIMPATGLTLAPHAGMSIERMRSALQDPFFNLQIGIHYLAWLRDHYKGLSPYYLVAAYNVGPARMDELLVRKDFKPTGTKKYFEAIRKGVPEFRFYRRKARLAQADISVKSI